MAEPGGRPAAGAGRMEPCPHCGIPMRWPTAVTELAFPDDLPHVEAFALGGLNTVTHLCGGRVTAREAVRVLRPAARTAVLVEGHGPPPEEWAVTWVPDMTALQAVVAGWLHDELKAFMRDLIAGRVDFAAVPPVRLLAYTLHDLASPAPTDPAGAERAAGVRTYVARTVVKVLVALTEDAARRAILTRLPAVLRERVPGVCLTPKVLAELARQCPDTLPFGEADGLDRLPPLWRAEYLNATAHALTRAVNPRSGHWAALLAGLWLLREQGPVDDGFFLDLPALRATTRFDELFAVAVPMVFPTAPPTLAELPTLRERFDGLMERAGYLDAFRTRVGELRHKLVSRSIAQGTPEEIAERTHHAMVADGATDDELGRSLADMAELLVRSGAPVDAVVAAFDRTARNRLGHTGRALFAARCCAWLTDGGHNRIALALVDELLTGDVNLADPDSRVRVYVFDRIGDVLLRAGRFPMALEAYDIALNACAELPDAERWTGKVRRHRAAVLQALGRYGEARAVLDAEVAADPDDAGLRHAAARLCEVVGDLQGALNHLTAALALHDIDRGTALMCALGCARVLRALGDHDAAARAALAAQTAGFAVSQEDRWLVAVIGLRTRPDDPRLRAFRDACRAQLLAAGPALLDADPLIRELLATEQVGDALAAGDVAAARSVLESLFPSVRTPAAAGAELALLWARVLARVPDGDPWPWLRHCVGALDERTPAGAESAYALGWLASVPEQVDQVLALAAALGGEPADLLAVYDLANGRELDAHVEAPVPQDRLAALRAAGLGLDVVAVLDGEQHLTLVAVPAAADRPAVVTTVPLDAAAVRGAVAGVRYFDVANPVAPGAVDAFTEHWWALADVWAAAVREVLPVRSTPTGLVVLPGRHLGATPLHAAGWPRRPLIEERPVMTCPNARVLLGGRGLGASARGFGVVAIPKAGDGPHFLAELDASVAHLAGQMPQTVVLRGPDADADAVLALCASRDEVALVCHGLSAVGDGRGPGLCVAAHGHLPPSTLPVEEDDELRAFVLGWSELMLLDVAPGVVVTVACSSGRSVTGPGGSHIGLEQGHLNRGGHAIVSPLWNVAQGPALAWLRAFYSAHQPGDAADLATSHRAATLAVAAEHPHPFAWAPFVLTSRATTAPAPDHRTEGPP